MGRTESYNTLITGWFSGQQAHILRLPKGFPEITSLTKKRHPDHSYHKKFQES